MRSIKRELYVRDFSLTLKLSCSLVFATIFVQYAHADAEYLGVQYKCDSRNSAIIVSAYDEGWYNVPRRAGYKVLPVGTYKLRCATKHGTVTSNVEVIPPGFGECRGSGSVYINDVSIGTRSFITRRDADFNFPCVHSDYFLSMLAVSVKEQSVTVRRCISNATTNVPYEVGCADEIVKR